jgi:hypothetical protein
MNRERGESMLAYASVLRAQQLPSRAGSSFGCSPALSDGAILNLRPPVKSCTHAAFRRPETNPYPGRLLPLTPGGRPSNFPREPKGNRGL